MKTLVVYFSAESGRTAAAAKELAEETGADLFAVVPEKPYTRADLYYINPLARCNREKIGHKDVPSVGRISDFDAYETVYIGFPIWYGGAPNVIETFCKGYDWSGKKVRIFATSGGSGIGKTAERLKPYLPGAVIEDAAVVTSGAEAAGRRTQ